MQEYVRREPDAVTLVHELLTEVGLSMDTLMANALAEKLDNIERIDRLTDHRRKPPQRQPERDRSASGGPRRNTATERARDRGRRV